MIRISIISQELKSIMVTLSEICFYTIRSGHTRPSQQRRKKYNKMIEKTQLGHKKIVLKSLQTTTIQPAYKLTKIINVEFH